MPELPEVETTLRGILPYTQHQRIVHVDIRHYQLRWPIPKNIKQRLKDKIIQSIIRRGKYLIVALDSGNLILHLGMSGHLRIVPANTPFEKHDHVDILLSNQKILRFNDPRRFGAFLWVDTDPLLHPLLKDLGLEPLDPKFSGRYLKQLAQGKKLHVKKFIMDSKVVTGVGNIYAQEALFLACIHPLTPVNQLTLTQFTSLAKSIQVILKKAIKQGGTTLKDFLNSDGKPGYFVNELRVYGRAGLPCKVCGTCLTLVRIAQRSTVYCERCQRI